MDTESRRRLARLGDAVDAAVADRPDAGGSNDLGELLRLLAMVDRLTARATALAGRVLATGAAEKRGGMELEAMLRVSARRTHGDARTLAVAGEVLGSMSRTAEMFADGVIGWGEVRAIVHAARALNAEQRAWLDGTLSARENRIAAMEPDAVVGEVDRLVASLRPEVEEGAHRAAYRRRFVAVQLALDGSSTLQAELPAEATAAVLSAIDLAARRIARGTADAADHELDPDEAEDWEVWRDRARRRADGLVEIAESYLAGSDEVRARPTMLLVADADVVTGRGQDGERSDTTGGAELLWNGPRGPIRLPREVVDRLSCDADHRLIMRDGTTIVGVTSSAEFVDDDLRAALHVRDHHCRFPGCRRPARHCVAHHVVWRRLGGVTALRNLALLCGRHHWAVHHGGWEMTVDATGVCRFSFGRRQHETLPPGRPGPDAGRDPPG